MAENKQRHTNCDGESGRGDGVVDNNLEGVDSGDSIGLTGEGVSA